MNIAEFIQNIEEEFEEVKPGTIKPDTEFKKLNGWSSMLALIIIAKIDTTYSITITAEELAECRTISDLFNIAHSKN